MNALTQPFLTSPRVLIIEDDVSLSGMVADQLRQYGFLARQCFDGKSGLTAATTESFNLILLDVLLPKMDGFAVLNKLRKQSDTPVIMLSACGAEEDRISGFRSGADDYLPKPFNVTELVLRIEAVIRRTQPRQPAVADTRQIEFNNLSVNADSHQVLVNGELVEITSMEFRVLWMLMENQNQPLSKPYLYQELMGRPYSRNERSLDMHISKLRRKLRAGGFDTDHIQTLHGQGYCFK